MLLHLVKKDFILAKRYIIFMIIFAAIGPVFIYTRLGINDGSFTSFLITVLFTEYILNNTVSLQEDKYKGAALLCTTPHSRNGVIKAKYLFILVIFTGSFLLYNLSAAIASNVGLTKLSIYNTGTALLIIAIFFGILIPVETKFGYEKTKYIFFIIIFLTPFLLPAMIDWYQSTGVNLHINIAIPQPIKEWLPFGLAILLGWFSMLISIRIYSMKNL